MTVSAQPSSTGTDSASPSRNSTWRTPMVRAVSRDFASISGVMSMPLTNLGLVQRPDVPTGKQLTYFYRPHREWDVHVPLPLRGRGMCRSGGNHGATTCVCDRRRRDSGRGELDSGGQPPSSAPGASVSVPAPPRILRSRRPRSKGRRWFRRRTRSPRRFPVVEVRTRTVDDVVHVPAPTAPTSAAPAPQPASVTSAVPPDDEADHVGEADEETTSERPATSAAPTTMATTSSSVGPVTAQSTTLHEHGDDEHEGASTTAQATGATTSAPDGSHSGGEHNGGTGD